MKYFVSWKTIWLLSDYYFVFIGVQKLKILKTTRSIMYISSKMMGKPRGRGPRNYDYITTHIETSSFRQHPKNVEASLLRWIPGKKFPPEYVTQAATPMWPIFDLRRFDTSVLLPQAMLHAAPLCVAAASCSPSLDSTGPLGPHDRPSATVDWIIRCLEDIFLDWRPVNQCTNSPQNASKRAFLHYKNPDIVYNF